jgi:hypothetical protein
METMEKYLKTTGISEAFQIVFAEIIEKKLKYPDSIGFASDRLREIGNGLAKA